jgi:hypothetical protein
MRAGCSTDTLPQSAISSVHSATSAVFSLRGRPVSTIRATIHPHQPVIVAAVVVVFALEAKQKAVFVKDGCVLVRGHGCFRVCANFKIFPPPPVPFFFPCLNFWFHEAYSAVEIEFSGQRMRGFYF